MADIDIVIPWVDSSDPVWRADKDRCAREEGRMDLCDDTEKRYRDWDTVRFTLRSIDRYMPWVRKVFFVTYGHLPEWLNKDAEKLVVVNHKDFIPEEYLPTFSSHAIELNMHRIKGLSEQFIYFNDDLMALTPLTPDQFFVDGLPRDYAILNVINTANRGSVQDVALSDMEIINDNFNSAEVMKRDRSKWMSSRYGKELYRTMTLQRWPYFTGFLSKHQCNPFLKSTFEEVWSKEFDVLDRTCRHKFRTRRDVNQWLMRYWQLASGKFIPVKPYGTHIEICDGDNRKVKEILNTPSYLTAAFNDNVTAEGEAADRIRAEVTSYFEEAYPEKSSFEK